MTDQLFEGHVLNHPPLPLRIARLRECTPDLEDLFVAYREFYGRAGDSSGARAFIRQRLRSRDSHVWVARNGDRIFAFAQVYPKHSSLALRTDWILNDLFVSPGERGTGAGRALVERTLTEATTEGVGTVRLETQRTNAVARRLYESCGFTATAPAADEEFVEYKWEAVSPHA
jgi:GNAT superfamily N-acetyltransferase